MGWQECIFIVLSTYSLLIYISHFVIIEFLHLTSIYLTLFIIFIIIIIFIFVFSVNLDEQYSGRIDDILLKLERICDKENSKNENETLFSEIEIKNGNALEYGEKNFI